MEKHGFTVTVYKKCEDGITRQVLAVDSQYLKAMIAGHGVNDVWQLPINEMHFVVFTHYKNHLRVLPWIKERLTQAWTSYQLTRALRKRAALGQSVTTISTQVVPTPEEFHAQLTSAQESLKSKPVLTSVSIKQAHGSSAAGTTASELCEQTISDAYWCTSCGSMFGEAHRPNCVHVK